MDLALALVDLAISVTLLVWWIVWSGRMLALQERLVQNSAEHMKIARDLLVDSRTLTKRLTE